MSAFNPDRLTLARLRAGFSKAGLAEACGLSTRTISKYEAGELAPEEKSLQSLAQTLDFPPAFFLQESAEGLPTADKSQRERISYRARSKLSQALQDSAVAAVCLAGQLHRHLHSKLTLPVVNLPDLSQYADDAETAAGILRTQWKLGHAPIGNLLALAESKGVMVFTLAINSAAVDAFSLWLDGVPMIFLNRQKTAERCRFDLAHELGHLLLHVHEKPQGREAEQQADRFASAFLLPQAAMYSLPLRSPVLSALLPVKKHWKVSAAALNYRLHQLGRLSEWNYRNNCIALARLGRQQEPGGRMAFESSALWPKIFQALAQAGISKTALAAELGWSVQCLNSMAFGLQNIQGGGKTSAAGAQPSLKIIK